MRMTLLLLLLPSVFLCSCAELFSEEDPTPPVFQEQNLPFVSLAQGDQGGTDVPLNLVIRNENQYRQIFGSPSSGFNFNSQLIVGCYKGRLPNGGNTYEINSVTERETDVLVRVRFGLCAPCTRFFTSPYHLITISQIEKNIVFEEY